LDFSPATSPERRGQLPDHSLKPPGGASSGGASSGGAHASAPASQLMSEEGINAGNGGAEGVQDWQAREQSGTSNQTLLAESNSNDRNNTNNTTGGTNVLTMTVPDHPHRPKQGQEQRCGTAPARSVSTPAQNPSNPLSISLERNPSKPTLKKI